MGKKGEKDGARPIVLRALSLSLSKLHSTGPRVKEVALTMYQPALTDTPVYRLVLSSMRGKQARTVKENMFLPRLEPRLLGL